MASDLNLIKIKDSIYLKKITSKKDLTLKDDEEGYYIDTSGDEKEARRIIDTLKGKNKIIALEGHTNQFNRRALETMKINYLVSPEKHEKKDTIKQRDSGINHVLAKIASKNKVHLVINANELRTLPKKEKALRLSRIIQNLKEARKAKCQIKIASLVDKETEIISKKDRMALIQTLKSTSKQTSDSIKF